MKLAIRRLVDQAPAAFMWQHQMGWGVSKAVTFKPRPADRVDGWEVFVN